MAKIMYKGKTYEMSMGEFYTLKRADEIVEELIDKPILYDEVMKRIRQHKINKIKNK